VAGYFFPVPAGVPALVGLSSLLGDFYIKYCISKAGIYAPLTA